MWRFGVAGLCLVALPTAAMAGAWTLPEGQGQAAITATASTATRAFDGSRDLVSAPRYNKLEVLGLFEYGVTDAFTVLGVAGMQHVSIAPPVDAQRTGLGQSELGGRYRLFQNDSWVLSAQATVRVPGTRDTVNPAAIGYTGVEGDFRLLLGRSFMLGTMPSFADLQIAQRARTEGPSEFRADLTFGFQVRPNIQLLVQSFNVFSEGDRRPTFPSYHYHKLQLSGVVAITPNLAFQLGGFSTVAGRNALQENGIVTGLWYKF